MAQETVRCVLAFDAPADLKALLREGQERCQERGHIGNPRKLDYHFTVKSSFMLGPSDRRVLPSRLELLSRNNILRSIPVLLDIGYFEVPEPALYLGAHGNPIKAAYDRILGLLHGMNVPAGTFDGKTPHCTLLEGLEPRARQECAAIFRELPVPTAVRLDTLVLYEREGAGWREAYSLSLR